MLYWIARPWRRLFDFSGRSPRREYWLFVLQFYAALFGFAFLAGLLLALVDQAPANDADGALAAVPAMALVGVMLLLFIPLLAVSVRRIHDHDKTAWLLLLTFVPAVGWIFLLIMMLSPGSDGENSYGPDPRDRSDAGEVATVFN